MYLVSSYWPASVPDTLWQFFRLLPDKSRSFPFVGIEVSWQFVVAALVGCVLIGGFAWKRFAEPTYDVNTQAFRDFRDLRVWNLKDSLSLRRGYVVYCISLIFIYAIFAFFGRIIVQLFDQLNVSGLQLSAGVVDFSSWRWPLLLALGVAGFAPLINPLVPAENWLRRFSHEVVGIPTRIREKAVRIRTLIDGAPSSEDARPTSEWVKATLGPKLNGCFVLERSLRTIVSWSYNEHVEWTDPEIRRKLNEHERDIRGEAEDALDEFEYLTDPMRVPDLKNLKGQGSLQQFEKQLAANVAKLETVRDKFAIIMAIYCEHGSRFAGMPDRDLRQSMTRLADVREPPATGLPLYAFIVIYILYLLFIKFQWHPPISSIQLTNQVVLINAALETLKVFLLIWLPPTAVAALTSVIGPELGDRSVKESRFWAVIPGGIAAFGVAAAGMTMFAILYAALPAGNLAQMQQSLFGTGGWTGALPYYLLFTPVAIICHVAVSWIRLASRPPSVWLTLVARAGRGCAFALVPRRDHGRAELRRLPPAG